MPNWEVDEQLLIQLVQELPVLWDTTLEVSNDKELAEQSWSSVCCRLKNDFNKLTEAEKSSFKKHVVRKWCCIKFHWTKWRKREKNLRKAGKCRLRKYIFHDKLQFLEKVEQNYENKVLNMPEDEDKKTDTLKTMNEINKDLAESIPKKRKSSCKQEVIKKSEEKPDPELMCGDSSESSKYRNILALPKKRKLDGDPDSRHLMFCKGIIPSIKNFNEDQVIDFQMGILHLIKNISHGVINHCCEQQCCLTHCHKCIHASSSEDSATNTYDIPTDVNTDTADAVKELKTNSKSTNLHTTLTSRVAKHEPLDN